MGCKQSHRIQEPTHTQRQPGSQNQNPPVSSRPRTVVFTEFYEEDTHEFINEFTDIYIRHSFIRKVYGILSVQLLITVAFVVMSRLIEPVHLYMKTSKLLFWLTLPGIFIPLLILVCCTSARHLFPLNYILLLLFTMAESLLVASVTCYYQTDILMLACGITAAACVVITIFAMQTKWDFTGMGIWLIIPLMLLLVLGLVVAFVPSKTLYIVYASLGAVIISVYMVFDTQLLLGGKHKYSLPPDEYILGALHLYIDIILLFLFILDILRLCSSS